ncbi:MAG: IS6 family transposase [Candidatus Thermoplasmatota archaeon]|nr:IS6 family transposase [Candidatus Thermoplasmatota archaeon]
MNIRPPENHIKLEPNKTFAGRTETGHVGCKFCKSHQVVKNGKRGDKQLYKCKSCGKQFVDNECFPRMRTSARAISVALEAYFDGLSLAKVVNLLRRVYGITINRATVWRWIQKYVPLVKKMMGQFTANATSSWHADETAVKIKGNIHWFWDGIDYDTRFIVMGLLTRRRSVSNARKFFIGAKAQVGGKAPGVIVTDGCGSYRKGVTKAFWRKVQLGECTLIQKAGLRARLGKLSNNVIERFHNTLKDRVKILRGFGSRGGASTALDGFVIQYNFLRRHTSLKGMTPAERAGIRLPTVMGWGDLIQWSLKRS